jgi:hypothetical protein
MVKARSKEEVLHRLAQVKRQAHEMHSLPVPDQEILQVCMAMLQERFVAFVRNEFESFSMADLVLLINEADQSPEKIKKPRMPKAAKSANVN